MNENEMEEMDPHYMVRQKICNAILQLNDAQEWMCKYKTNNRHVQELWQQMFHLCQDARLAIATEFQADCAECNSDWDEPLDRVAVACELVPR